MRERGWRLDYTGTSYEFGGIDPDADPFGRNYGRVYVMSYEASDVDLITEDSQLPRSDGTRMGQDYRGGRVHTFTLGIRGRSRAEAEAMLADLERVWRGDAARRSAGKRALLWTLQNGQMRGQYGRPRKFQPNYDRLAAYEASALCTFETIDDVWWGIEQTRRIDLRAVSTDGFVFPCEFPLVMAEASTAQDTFTVDGTLPSWLVVELHGPIGNPRISLVNGWTAGLQSVLGAGRVVTFDPRPGIRTIVDQDGGSYAGALTRTARLSQMMLPAGDQQVQLSGTDYTGTAYMIVKWRPAYAGRG